MSDRAGAQSIVAAVVKKWPWPNHSFADAFHDRTRLMDAATYWDFGHDIIRSSDKELGFKVLPRRWAVKRTFGWMTRREPLVRDHGERIDVSETIIDVAPGEPYAP
jgi:putative transposase